MTTEDSERTSMPTEDSERTSIIVKWYLHVLDNKT